VIVLLLVTSASGLVAKADRRLLLSTRSFLSESLSSSGAVSFKQTTKPPARPGRPRDPDSRFRPSRDDSRFRPNRESRPDSRPNPSQESGELEHKTLNRDSGGLLSSSGLARSSLLGFQGLALSCSHGGACQSSTAAVCRGLGLCSVRWHEHSTSTADSSDSALSPPRRLHMWPAPSIAS
jgi:hypothetical protein